MGRWRGVRRGSPHRAPSQRLGVAHDRAQAHQPAPPSPHTTAPLQAWSCIRGGKLGVFSVACREDVEKIQMSPSKDRSKLLQQDQTLGSQRTKELYAAGSSEAAANCPLLEACGEGGSLCFSIQSFSHPLVSALWAFARDSQFCPRLQLAKHEGCHSPQTLSQDRHH